MSVFQNLSVLALRQLVNGACHAVGISGVGDQAVDFLINRFTVHSQKLEKALQNANERAWKALEIALAGDSLLNRLLGNAEDRAFAQQIRAFLDASPFRKHEKTPDYREALKELRDARNRGVLSESRLAYDELARQAGSLARFSDPQAQLDAEWKVIEQTACQLRENYPKLYAVLVADAPLVQSSPAPSPTILSWFAPWGRKQTAQTPSIQSPSILAVAVRYYFRVEVAGDTELFQGLAFAKLEALQESQDKGFAALTEALTQQGERLDDLMGWAKKTHNAILDLQWQIEGQTDQIKQIGQAVLKLLDQRQLQHRELRSSDSMSIRNDDERQLVKQVVVRYRALPEKDRQLPALLNAVGKLEVVAGDFAAAHQDFQRVVTMVPDSAGKAEVHYNAYKAALEQEQWAEALNSLRQAIALDPGRFAPFPLDRYEPTRILGAGGFGVAFLCYHKFMRDNLVVKTLQSDELDCNVDRVFNEAQALRRLDNPSIIRLSECGYADAEGKSRPYLAMDYFEGMNLESYVEEQGLLSAEDLLPVALQVAQALQAAHERGILHRDVKPANILVRRESDGWRVKLIDFGLALRPSTLEGKVSTSGPRAQTTMGKTIAGTLHYAAPEQMGQLPGVEVGTYSDVYGFGKSCYYALCNTPAPDHVERKSVPEAWLNFMDRCTGRTIANRLPDFAAVLAGLAELRQQASVQVVAVATLKEKQTAGKAETTGGESIGVNQGKGSDWNAALANITNTALVAFYKKELAAGQENYLRKRYLRYRIAGKRRWFIAARRRNAYVWQHGRFDGDIDFWRSGLNQPDQVKAVKNGACLSFSLSTDQDFQFFRQAATQKLLNAKWTETESDDEPDSEVEGVVPVGVLALYLKSKGIVATGYEAEEGFVVLVGSQAVKETVPSIPGAQLEKRNSLIQQGILVAGPDSLILKKEYTFESASMAAGVLLGRSANGRVEWKDTDGRTLKEIQNAAQVEPPPPDPPERGVLLKKFWEGLLSRPKVKPTRYANLTPGDHHWIGAGSGVRGQAFNFVIGQEEGKVELYIDRGSGKAEENKRVFDLLLEHKVEIEAAFGGGLSWQRLDEKQACRIAYILTACGYKSDESKWQEIQDAMIDAMIRLEKALVPFLVSLPDQGDGSSGRVEATVSPRERKINLVKHLRNLGATTASTARPLGDLGEKLGYTRSEVYDLVSGTRGKAGLSPTCLLATGHLATTEMGGGLAVYLTDKGVKTTFEEPPFAAPTTGMKRGMDLSPTFNSLLREAGFSPGDFRLIRHADSRADRGRSPFDLWRDNRPQFELYQSTQAIENRKKLTAPYWAVFLGAPSGETMFVGIYSVKYQGLLKEDREKPHVKGEVDKAGSCDVYELTLQPALGDHIGKLFIDWGPGALAWVQYADRQEKPIIEPGSQDDTGDTSGTEPGRPNEPWNGEFYFNYGDGPNRSWADALEYNFICAGGGLVYSKGLQQLNPGDRVWVKAPGHGFVGVCRVTAHREPASAFKVKTADGEVPVLDVVKGGKYHREYVDDPERCEYFVPVQWLQTVPLEQAVNEPGLFGNQTNVCKPTSPKWRATVEKLQEKFPDYNK